MKKFICVVLFFVVFTFLNSIVSFFPDPPHTVMYLYIWTFTGLISLLTCKQIYDWLVNEEKGILPPRRRAIIVLSAVFISSCVWGIRYWDEYREKPLNNILESFSYPIVIYIDPATSNAQTIHDSENINALLEFLSQYQVQKLKDGPGLTGPIFRYSWENEKGWRGPVVAMLWINEHYMLIGTDYYKVLNGPIDLEWLKELNARTNR